MENILLMILNRGNPGDCLKSWENLLKELILYIILALLYLFLDQHVSVVNMNITKKVKTLQHCLPEMALQQLPVGAAALWRLPTKEQQKKM